MGSCAGMGAGAGLGGRQFVPDDLLSGATGLFADLDAPGAVTRNTQPNTSGGWAGASWAGSGLGPYTHTPGDTTALAAAICIVGNRYLTRFTVSDRTAGSVTFYAGTTAGTARSTNDTFTEELTCAGTASHNFVPSADFDGKVTVDSVVVVANLSVSQVTCKGNLGNLVRATAANMPWDSDAAAPTSVLVNGRRVLYFDGVADYLTAASSTAKFKFLHDGTGGVLYLVVNRTGGDYMFSTGNSSPSSVGAAIRCNYLFVGNGSGTLLINQAVVIPTGQYNIIEYGLNATGFDFVVNGGVPVTGGLTGAPSAANATFDLDIMRRQSGNNIAGGVAAVFTRNVYDAPTSANRVNLRRYFAAKYWITLA